MPIKDTSLILQTQANRKNNKMPLGTIRMRRELTITMLLGLFLEWDPNVNKPHSFLEDKNSKDDGSSNGSISFFLLRSLL